MGPGDPGPVRVRRIRGVFLPAVFFALLTSLCELGLVANHRYILDEITHVSPHVVWMAPVANLGFFALTGLLLLAFAWRWPGLASLPVTAPVYTCLAAFAIVLALPWKLHIVAALILPLGVAAQVHRWTKKRADGLGRRLPGATVVLAVLIGGLVIGVAAPRLVARRAALAALPAATAGAPNILLIILDTVRAKSLDLYGYERPTAPNLTGFAEEGLVFEKAIATAPWTLPSHASIFTGRFHHELSTEWEEPLDGTHPTLAEALASVGYATGGFVANLLYTSYVHGLSRGFQHYEDYPVSAGQVLLSSSLGRLLAPTTWLHRVLGREDLLTRKSAGAIVDAALDWVAANGDEANPRPFFAFLNLFDAHEPYLPPAPFDTLFGPTGPRPLFREVSLTRDTRARRPAKWIMTPAELSIEHNAYDASIAYMDSELGRLFRKLEEMGRLENTIVIVTSDHGEQHGEHHLFGHLNSLYAPLLHVPLVIAGPGIPTGRVDGPASLRDLPATLQDLLRDVPGLAATSPLPGSSLAPRWRSRNGETDAPDPTAQPALSTLHRGISLRPWYPVLRGPEMHSLWDGDHHYICNGDGFEELYEITTDPDEENDLASGPDSTRLPRFRDQLGRLLGQRHLCSSPTG
jgi:arylsulfatase A-like enzyme